MAAPVDKDDFKAHFVRDFVYGATNDKVLDADIDKAILEASVLWNDALWSTTEEKELAYLYLTAHFLVLDIQAAGGLSAVALGKGVESQGEGVMTSRSVGPVSAQYAFPQAVTENPLLNQLQRTNYGQKFLQMALPRLVGAGVATVEGWGDESAGEPPNAQ